ncbi:hypothetical protein D3C76_1307430 [compost metagenome]
MKVLALPPETAFTPAAMLSTVTRVVSTPSIFILLRTQPSLTPPSRTAMVWLTNPRLTVARQVGPLWTSSPLSARSRDSGASRRTTAERPAV